MATAVHLPTELGCYIDGSADNPDSFSKDVIDFAVWYGFTYDPMPDEDSEDFSQILYEISEDAVSWLNEHTVDTDEGCWVIDDSCLMLVGPDWE